MGRTTHSAPAARHAPQWPARRVADAVFYLLRSGCAWRVLPRDFPPRRRVVERTFAWLGHSRRLSKDYERLPAVSEAMIYGAMSRLMLRRLTHVAA